MTTALAAGEGKYPMTLEKFLEPMKKRDARVSGADSAVAALGLDIDGLYGSVVEREAFEDRRALIAKCEKLGKALAFYADKANWHSRGGGTCSEIVSDDWSRPGEDGLRFGGTKARKTLGEG